MANGAAIKSKRIQAGIAGHILCSKLGDYARSRLSGIENGYLKVKPEELARLDAALDDLIQAKSFIDRAAASVGWPSGARRDR